QRRVNHLRVLQGVAVVGPWRARQNALDRVDGGLAGFVQSAPRMVMGAICTEQVEIPISKALLFRTVSRKNNPEGKSILRSAYRPWFFKKRLEEGEAIGLWRNLTGLPIAYIPAKFMDPHATPVEKQVLASIQKLVRDTVIDEQAGVILPGDRDEKGNRLFELSLLSTGTHSKVDARSAINAYNAQIAMTVLADFVMLGAQSKNGSFALSVNKTDLFTTALQTWVNSIAAVLNRYLLPPIWEMNGFDPKLMPKFKPGTVAQIDMAALGDLIQKMAGAGATLFPDKDLEDSIRNAAGLPASTD
ncbi:MAG: hypothetical protein J0626_09750, partial [Rhodospirillaceae bacterium]|nr:hypothetical protein [Rhodospirillaceae bacterium]